MTAFHCDQCGLCCRLLKDVPQLAAYDRGDGVCKFLQGRRCTIYARRPDICNVEKMWPIFAATMTRAEYETAMTAACAKIKAMFARAAPAAAPASALPALDAAQD